MHMDIQMGVMVVQVYRLEWTPGHIQRLADPDLRRSLLKIMVADGKTQKLVRWLDRRLMLD